MPTLGEEEAGVPRPRIGIPEAHTIIGRGARFKGKLTFQGEVRIDGYFEGEIFTDDLLVVGAEANVKAKLEVGSVVICGRVEGDVVAKTAVELRSESWLKGNITTPSLVVEKGVFFDGNCNMTNGEDAPGTAPPPRSSTVLAGSEVGVAPKDSGGEGVPAFGRESGSGRP